MKAAYINEIGGPEKVVYGDLPEPKPGLTEYLIKVAAVDVNPVDIYIRAGMVPNQLKFPYILGRDLAGKIVACGKSATKFRVGDRVWCVGQGWEGRQGTFAEFAAVDERWLNRIPPNVSDEAAAAISLVGITAHIGLKRAKVHSGDLLFVNGGSGGVGSSVIQMAKILGAHVITTAGSDQKAEKCRRLGADLAINYKTQNVADAVKQFAPAGINVWWETLREPNFDQIISLLSSHGRIIVMAGRDARPAFPVGPFYTKDCSLFGFAILNSPQDELRAAADDINHWLAEGKLIPQIDRVIPLSEASNAHRLQEESTIKKTGSLAGKIVLKP